MDCIHNFERKKKLTFSYWRFLQVYQLESYTRLKNIKKLAGKM